MTITAPSVTTRAAEPESEPGIGASELGILPGAGGGAQFKIYDRGYGHLRGSSGSGPLPRC